MSLPHGWIQEYDPIYNHPFWVDTRSKPPRAIWVHPYEDEQFLADHPEVREKADRCSASELDEPPPYDAATGGASGSGDKPGPSKQPDLPVPDAASGADHKRGVFGRLKDKIIGTREEREEHRRIRAERAARAEEEARVARRRELEAREAYMRAHGGYAPYRPSYPARAGYGPSGDNSAAFLLGGLAGGLLLGDIFGGF